MSTGADPRAPSIDGLEILSCLGSGGMGAVYLARDVALDRRVAVKVVLDVRQSDEARARFRHEARLMASVEHPNVVRVYASGEAGGHPYIVMEYVEGRSLADLVAAGPLAPERAASILREAALGLAAAWEKGIVHRDIKPANILLDARGHVHVSDFGLAKARASGDASMLTPSREVMGTPHYMPPEQALSQPLDFRADVFSLGVVAFHMLAGRPPFDGDSPVAVLYQILENDVPPLEAVRPGLPEELCRLVAWMTRREASERPASYAEILERLDGPGAPRPGSPTATYRPGGEASAPTTHLPRPAPAVAPGRRHGLRTVGALCAISLAASR